MNQQFESQLKLDPVTPIQFIYEQISVQAQIQNRSKNQKEKENREHSLKTILKQCSGKFKPNTMTAILGPSGSGKTTMLNLLSGRILSQNLLLRGRIKINGKLVKSVSKYKNIIGYVMQQDLMIPTFTPRQTFRFITDMRMAHKTSQQKNQIVEKMLLSLGLKSCADTFVGNSIIRGISGGQKKRTSVGVQLLTNPSLLFLDQPTTGLDSVTALNLIKLLNKLANSGRTVITTIHQPSSQIFLQFDMIMLLVDGNVIYHNRAIDSMNYFSKLEMPVPPFSNPMDYYMKIMNKQQISMRYISEGKDIDQAQVNKLFEQRLLYFSNIYKSQQNQLNIQITDNLNKRENQASWLRQMILIFRRSLKTQYRNPLGAKAKLSQILFFVIILIILYNKQSKTIDGYIQNTTGYLFFVVLQTIFPIIYGSINVFSQQKQIFIRQRYSNTYRTSSFFVGRSLANLPFQFLTPFILILLTYFFVHLDNDPSSFFITLAATFLAAWMASSYALCISAIFQLDVALSLVFILVVTLELVSGFYATMATTPKFFKIFLYLSMFKFQYQLQSVLNFLMIKMDLL